MTESVELEVGRGGTFGAIHAALLAIAGLAILILALAPAAHASKAPTEVLADGTERTTYTVGPLEVTPGQNRIAYRPVLNSERPSVDGWITGIKPDLVRADGSTPLSGKVMFHHDVWLNLSKDDATSPGYPGRFFATGE